MKAWIALAASLLAGLLLAWWASRTPAPAPADAPYEVFSAGRAFDDVGAIARRPHPTGSAENARVRDYLLARTGQLGLELRIGGVQAAEFGARGAALKGAAVENVIAVLPGRDRQAPAVLVMTHYDSVPGSPGAADDAAGVAAALEIARAIKAAGQPHRDVIFLFTDAEELGLLGAQAFFERLPLARRVGFVINMEARGGGGRAIMFETGRGNRETVRLFAEHAPRPSSNSLAVFVYENMPNGTDFTHAKNAGLQGLNFAFIGRPAQYHTSASTPEALDQGSLQHIGEQGLAAARAAAFSTTLPQAAPDAVYSDVLGSFVLAYSPLVGWVLLLVGALATAFAVLRARAQGLAPWRDVARGAAGALCLLLLVAALLRLARRLTGVGFGYYEQYALLGRFGVYETAVGLLCLACVLLAVGGLLRDRMRLPAIGLGLLLAVAFLPGLDTLGLGLALGAAALAAVAFGRALAPWGLWAGFLLTGLVLAAVLQAAEPTIAFLVTWPLLLAAFGAAVTAGLRQGWAALVVGVAVAALALGQLGSWAHPMMLGIGGSLPSAMAPLTLLAALCLCPLLLAAAQARGLRIAGLGALAAGLAVVFWLRSADPSDFPAPQRPEPAAAAAAA